MVWFHLGAGRTPIINANILPGPCSSNSVLQVIPLPQHQHWGSRNPFIPREKRGSQQYSNTWYTADTRFSKKVNPILTQIKITIFGLFGGFLRLGLWPKELHWGPCPKQECWQSSCLCTARQANHKQDALWTGKKETSLISCYYLFLYI